MDGERLRIVILNFNRAVLSAQCASYAVNQIYHPKDILVVDNNSSPDEYHKLRALLPSEVLLLRCPSNLGYAAGNNVGIKLADRIRPSTFTMVLNNDAFLTDPQTSSHLIAALRTDRNRVACSPLVNTVGTNLPPSMQIQVTRIPRFIDLLIASSWWLRRLPGLSPIVRWYVYDDAKPYPSERQIDCESINGSCFLIRTDFLRQIDYLDEGTFLYFEEIILGKQIKTFRKKACLVTSTVVHHFQGSTTGQKFWDINIKHSKHRVSSEIYYCRKYLKVSMAAIGILILIRVIDITTKAVYHNFLKILRDPRHS